MNDKVLLEKGRRCQRLFREAHALLDEVDEELVRRLGFKSIEEFEAFINDGYENDMTIDTLQLCQGAWDKKAMKDALEYIKVPLRNMGVGVYGEGNGVN